VVDENGEESEAAEKIKPQVALCGRIFARDAHQINRKKNRSIGIQCQERKSVFYSWCPRGLFKACFELVERNRVLCSSFLK
jgi:hypothetical protein